MIELANKIDFTFRAADAVLECLLWRPWNSFTLFCKEIYHSGYLEDTRV